MNILSSINKSIIVKIDTEKSLDRENLNLNNLTIYTTEKGQITEINHIGIDERQKLIEIIEGQ